MTTSPPPLQSVLKDFESFIAQQQTVILGTLSPTNRAEASYAPYVKINENYFIYVSELAKHTTNLIENADVSLLFIESEQEAKNIYARKRATLESSSVELERNGAEWLSVMDALEAKFGEMIAMLRPLQDFHLFKITPQKATFVRGFAQAYDLSGDHLQTIKHINDRGHGKSTLNQPENAND